MGAIFFRFVPCKSKIYLVKLVLRFQSPILLIPMFQSLKIIPVVLLLAACSPPMVVQQSSVMVYRLQNDDAITADATVDGIVAPYKTALDAEMNRVLAVSAKPMDKGVPEGLLGNFVSDLCLEIINQQVADSNKADFCFFNNGGFRTTLPAGDITRRKAFELMPFENELVVVTLDGAATKKLINFIAAKGGMPVGGIRIGISDNKATKVTINGIAFDEQKSYRVLTSDYLANGGDNLSLLAGNAVHFVPGIKMRDAIIMHMEKLTAAGKQIDVRLDYRIYYE